VLIPAENWQDAFEDETELEIIPVRRIEEVIQLAFRPEPAGEKAAVEPDVPREKYVPAQGGKEDLVVAVGG
jgi:predicted ATP-dependent protease